MYVSFDVIVTCVCIFSVRTLSQLCGKSVYQNAKHELELIQKVRTYIRMCTLVYARLFTETSLLKILCMYHACSMQITIDLHALNDMHVIMLMYMHASCNMHGFRTFSMHVACMLHACMHVIVTCMLCVPINVMLL